MRACALAVTALIVLACAGCSARQGDFTLLSTQNVDLKRVMLAREQQNPEPTVGKDVQHWFLIFPVSSAANLEEAVDDTLERGRGDCMADAVIYSYWWHIILYGQTGWEVKGKVLDTYKVKME